VWIVNLSLFRELKWAYFALGLFMFSRFVGSAIVVYTEEILNRYRQDGPPAEKGEGVIPLFDERSRLLTSQESIQEDKLETTVYT